MSDTFVLVQLSDPHIGATWAGDHSSAGLSSCVDAVLEVSDHADAVLLTGDLADHAADREYRIVKALIARIDAPLFVVPGNHDVRAAMRRHFHVAGDANAPFQYAAEVGPLRLVMVDSTRPGEASGALPRERLAWLENELGRASDRPTVVAMHHPPFRTGSDAWDRIGLPATDQVALAGVLARHRQVQRVVAGHVHRAMTAEVGGRPALTVPSSYVQAHLDLRSDEIAFGNEPPGFAVHTFTDGEFVSHIQTVDASSSRHDANSPR